MGNVIGKVLATEKNPSTMEEFYFWTKPELILNPFDVVKVEHIQESVTFGVVEEISHITDTANFLSDYISNDIMGPLSRPRSKILRVAVSRIILSSEASKVKLVGNLVA